MMNYCVIIPAYREAGRIGGVVEAVRRFCGNVVVVDDGSDDSTAVEAEKAGAVVIRHGVNRGKGIALNTGLKHAQDKNYDFAITMDADGQHDPSDLPQFLDEYARSAPAAIVGNRMGRTGGMPVVRSLTNRFMSWLLSRRMGQFVPDTQCGYRLYRKDVLSLVQADSAGYAAESEVLLKLSIRGFKIASAPIKIIYGDEKSKIHPVRDTLRFFRMLGKYRRPEFQEPRSDTDKHK